MVVGSRLVVSSDWWYPKQLLIPWKYKCPSTQGLRCTTESVQVSVSVVTLGRPMPSVFMAGVQVYPTILHTQLLIRTWGHGCPPAWMAYGSGPRLVMPNWW